MASAGGDWSTIWLLPKQLKDSRLSEAKSSTKDMFEGTGMVISTEGEQYLGGAVSTSLFIRLYVKRKVKCWMSELEKLSTIAETQPHAAYAAYTHGLSSNGITF